MHDALTGLPNRAKFYSRLEHAIRTADPGDFIALLLVDLDRFKEINDTLGHHYGDEVLRQVAQRLRQRIGQDATVARLGGDEFAILLPRLKTADIALEVAEEARRSLTAPLDAAGIRLDLGGSVGVATFPDDGRDVETLLQRADIAMYEAKSGRTGVERYSREQDANSLMRLTLAGDLRRALEQGEFVTHFQPKIDLETNRVHGAEALVRWHHPQRGAVPPDVFIGIAEQTGFIVPLTMRVLEDAIRACSQWRRHGAQLTVAVNLSARVLLEPEPARHRHGNVPRPRPARGCARARDHREHGRSRPRAGASDPHAPRRAGHRALGRRLRHRLLLARVPQAAPGLRAQDRPRLRDRNAIGSARRRDRPLGHPPGPQPRAASRRRGCRVTPASRRARRPRLPPGARLPLQPRGRRHPSAVLGRRL